MTMTRRRFVAATAATAGLSTLPALAGAATEPANRKLNILMLGGTGFLGPHTVRYALDRDPDVDDGLAALAGRQWDAVIDTSGFVPRIVGASAGLLADNVGQYLFVSTICQYDEWMEGDQLRTEDWPRGTLEDPTTEDVGTHYCYLKAYCEMAAEEAMPGPVLPVEGGRVVHGEGREERAHAVRVPHREVGVGGELHDPFEGIRGGAPRLRGEPGVERQRLVPPPLVGQAEGRLALGTAPVDEELESRERIRHAGRPLVLGAGAREPGRLPAQGQVLEEHVPQAPPPHRETLHGEGLPVVEPVVGRSELGEEGAPQLARGPPSRALHEGGIEGFHAQGQERLAGQREQARGQGRVEAGVHENRAERIEEFCRREQIEL